MKAGVGATQMWAETRSDKQSLGGRSVVITRPSGTAAALRRRVRALGGFPILLPGLRLCRVDDEGAARIALRAALGDDVLIFTSPAAVRHAAMLVPLLTSATVLAVGEATVRALRRRGVVTLAAPERQDSEGLLAHAALQRLAHLRVALIGASGGRGLLRTQLATRGARLREVHVYRRAPPRLDRRHLGLLENLPPSALVLWSSAEALTSLHERLPPSAWARLASATAVVSSDRLAAAVSEAGFARIIRAASALSADLLQAAVSID